MVHQLARPIVQRLAQVGKPFIQRYVTKNYGEIAGTAAGIAISLSVGDYYGAFSGITGNSGDEPPGGRNPPFGYYPGEGVNGKGNGTQYQTYNSVQYSNNRRGRKKRYCACRRYTSRKYYRPRRR